MRTLKIFATLTLVLLASAGTLSAQTVTHSSGGTHDCGLRTASHSFTAPKGTISYYDFISNLGTYYKKSEVNDWYRIKQFRRYNSSTNEYLPAPPVAFNLSDGFFSIELGSLQKGKKGEVYFRIRAYECSDLVLRDADSTAQYIAHLAAHLRFQWNETVPPQYAGKYVETFGENFLKAIANSGRVVVVATPLLIHHRSQGDRIQELNIEFIIEDYAVLESEQKQH